MSRRRGQPNTPWPRPKGPVAFPLNGRQSVPILNQGNTMRRVDIVRAFKKPLTPADPVPEYIFYLGMVRSDGEPIQIACAMPMAITVPEALGHFNNALKHLQTYLNCGCRGGVPCVHHKDPTPQTPSIILTDAAVEKKPETP